jgi:hypothetical protein
MLDLTIQKIGLDYVLFGWYDGGNEIQVMGNGPGREAGEELRANGGDYTVTKVFYSGDLWVLTARKTCQTS